MLLTAFLLCACQPDRPELVITNVTLIDAEYGERKNQTVIIDGDNIVAVTPVSETPPDAEHVIDGSGQFLIPGLWDFHVHLTYDDRFTETMPDDFLRYGITSVRDTGGLMHKIKPVVDKMRAVDAIAPRVFYSGPLLDGQHVVYDGDSRPEIGVQNVTAKDAEQMVRSLHEQGIDFIKVYEMVSADVFEALVQTANELGLPVDSHVPLALRASTAGAVVDSIEHLRNIELDCAANAPELHETRLQRLNNEQQLSGYALRASLHSLQRLPAIENYDEQRCDQTIDALLTTLQVPTLRLNALSLEPPYQREGWEAALKSMPESVSEPWSRYARENAELGVQSRDTRFAEWSLFFTGRAHQKGVPIGAGTDTPIGYAIPGFSLHSELQLLVKAGLSPLEALQAATVRPAEFFGLQQEMGLIKPGMRADLVLLKENPLEDIGHTLSIDKVISKGRLYPDESSAGRK